MNKAREILRTCAIICSKKEKNILSHRIAIKLPPKCASPPQLTALSNQWRKTLANANCKLYSKMKSGLGLDWTQIPS